MPDNHATVGAGSDCPDQSRAITSPSPNSRPWHEQQWRILGNWEPKMFLKRRGDGAFCDVDRLWDQIHSDDAVTRMARLGINLSHIHFHKGYGLEHERESIEEAKAWAMTLHQNDIRVGVYIGCTVFTETFGHPNREQIIACDGGVTWSPEQYFRRFWCYNNPQSRAYFEQVITIAIREVGADVLHFDASFTFVHGCECRCDHCLAEFRQFLRDERPDAVVAAGYDRAEHLSPPPLRSSVPVSQPRCVKDPGTVAWALYQARAGVKALEHFIRYARALRDDVAILINDSTLCGIPPFCCSNMEIAKLRLIDVTCVEDSIENPPGITTHGMPVSRFRAYKAAARHQTRVCYYTTETGLDSAMMLAEAAVFNHASLGFVETAMQSNHRVDTAEAREMLDYIVGHEYLFLDRDPWHHVAVIRHHASQILNPFPSGLSPYVIEQLLFERHVPFTILCEEDLEPDALMREFNLIILPDCACLSDREIDAIETFVRAGGSMLSIGNTATMTPINQLRSRWGLAGLLGCDAPASPDISYAEVAHSDAATIANADHITEPLTSALGEGRAIHLPCVAFDLPDQSKLHGFAGFDWYYHPYWRAPHNAKRIAASVDALIGQQWQVRINLPRHVGVEFYRAKNEHRVQFVNYGPNTAAGSITFHHGALPGKIETITWDTPGQHHALEHTCCAAGDVTVQLPAIQRLATLRVYVAAHMGGQ